MDDNKYLDGKRVLIVDDEPDILDTLEDLLPMCETFKAASFDEARDMIATKQIDLAILDIMGVDGYKLLELSKEKGIVTVMLTARALSPGDVMKSYKGGADSYVPKEEMVNITTFLVDVLEAKQKGKNTWNQWMHRLGSFCEKTFGKDWQEPDKDFWDKFPFY